MDRQYRLRPEGPQESVEVVDVSVEEPRIAITV